jgi:hypothetical protein
MTDQNLLVELFVEELPPKALKKLGESFANVLFEQLRDAGLTDAQSVVTPYASPRRLAAHVTQVAAQAADKAVQQKLMPVTVGLDAAGNATPALLKKLQALGADVSDPAAAVAALKRAPDGKAEALFYDSVVQGASLQTGLQKALEEALAKAREAAMPREAVRSAPMPRPRPEAMSQSEPAERPSLFRDPYAGMSSAKLMEASAANPDDAASYFRADAALRRERPEMFRGNEEGMAHGGAAEGRKGGGQHKDAVVMKALEIIHHMLRGR